MEDARKKKKKPLNIKKAIKKPGSLRKALKVPEGEKIPISTLRKVAKQKTKAGKQTTLAKKAVIGNYPRFS